MLASQSAELMEILEEMNKVTDDDALWYKYHAREKALRDASNIYRHGYDEGVSIGEERGISIGERRGEQRGISIGKKLGEQRGKIEGLLLADFSVDKISALTGASVDEVVKIKNNIEK